MKVLLFLFISLYKDNFIKVLVYDDKENVEQIDEVFNKFKMIRYDEIFSEDRVLLFFKKDINKEIFNKYDLNLRNNPIEIFDNDIEKTIKSNIYCGNRKFFEIEEKGNIFIKVFNTQKNVDTIESIY